MAAPFLYPRQFSTTQRSEVRRCGDAHGPIRFSACREGVSTVQQSTRSAPDGFQPTTAGGVVSIADNQCQREAVQQQWSADSTEPD